MCGNQRVPGSSPGAPTTQSSETHANKSASGRAAFAAISRAWWSPISGLCAEISSLRLFRRASLPAAKISFLATGWRGYWKARFSEWANLGPLLLRTQLIVLHGVRSTSFVGAFGPRFSANADSKPPTQRAAMAQQIRLSAPRNISSLKLRDLPALNTLAPSSSLSPKIVKPILRSSAAG